MYDDEVTEADAPAYAQAKRDLASFKFRILRTVAADPLLKSAPCAAAMLVLTSYATIDKRTLKPTTPYASIIKLQVEGGMSKRHALETRELFEKHGYVVRTNSKSKAGSIKYRLENPHEERVAMHIREATEYLNAKKAEEERERRRRKAIKNAVGSVLSPTQNDHGSHIEAHVGLTLGLNYHGAYREGISSEGTHNLSGVSSDPLDQRFPVPASDDEAADIVMNLLTGVDDRVVFRCFDGLRDRLLAGDLTVGDIQTVMDVGAALAEQSNRGGHSRAA